MRPFILFFSLFFLTACGGGSSGVSPDISDSAEIWQPAPGTTWQIQLQGDLNTTYNVDVYDVDLFDVSEAQISAFHSEGRKVVCYFSAGSFENWREDAGDFPASVIGNDLDGWPGESWLDIRDLETLIPVMESRMDIAVQKGCDGVDPDNVDGYTNSSGFPLTYADQLTYNIAVAQAAHERSLAVGLKNDLNQINDLIEYFDFAVNEQCFEYDECSLVTPFIEDGKAVFNIEYELTADDFCMEANSYSFSSLIMSYDLDGERYSCTE